MKLPRRKFLHLSAGAPASLVLSRIARAQSYPSRPITRDRRKRFWRGRQHRRGAGRARGTRWLHSEHRPLGGISRPIALAVLTLITSVNLVGRSIGKSAGACAHSGRAYEDVARSTRSRTCAVPTNGHGAGPGEIERNSDGVLVGPQGP
jgi:hypothetical protein